MGETKQSKATAGPWCVEVADQGNSSNSLDILAQDGYTVAIIINEDSSDRRDNKMRREWANARLIAAAPELYEALQAVVNSVTGRQGRIDVRGPYKIERIADALELAEAALLKARG